MKTRFTRITIDPAQMGGIPCLRGLRIPVATVVGLVALDRRQEPHLAEVHPEYRHPGAGVTAQRAQDRPVAAERDRQPHVVADLRVGLDPRPRGDRRVLARLLVIQADRDAVVLGARDQVAQGKPAPDVFLEAARRLGVAPSQCVVLEDSETGLLAARAAGMHPVLIQRRESLRATLRPHAILALASLVDFAVLIGNTG